MNRTEQRFERFAQLRAAYPDEEYDRIMLRIHDEEIEQGEADAAREADARDEERNERYMDNTQ